MTTASSKEKAIFNTACEFETPAQRAAYLNEACSRDPGLRARLDALLQAHDRDDPLLDRPAAVHLGDAAHGLDGSPDKSAAKSDADNAELEAALSWLTPPRRAHSLGRVAHYEVLEVIGRGGMGIVVRAFDEKLHRVVAIKMLTPALAGNGTARQRFVREAVAAAAVTHENVIAIHAVEDAGPVPYIVMQCVDGKTLQDKLDACGPLDLKQTLRVGLQIAEGLAAAHRQGLIHRDIKPTNILLENGVERVKITDFGLARAVDDASLTRSGFVAGTPLYMSPEQAAGEHVDQRTDLFSLGSVLYAMCAGHPPFRASTALAVLKRVCEDTPRPLREINPDMPEWLETLIAKLHAKNAAERPASASEVAAVLSRRLAKIQAGAGDKSEGDATAQVGRLRRPAGAPGSGARRFSRALVGAALVVGVALVAVAGWLVRESWLAEQPDKDVAVPGAAAPPSSKDAHASNTDAQTVKAPPSNAAPAKPIVLKPIVLKPSPPLMHHERGVRSLAFSRDGAVLASGGLDRHIYLWDTKTWEARGPLDGHPGDVVGLSFAPDGMRLASVSSTPDDCLVRVWDVASGNQVATLGKGPQSIWDVAYSPDGLTLACGGFDKQLHLFDTATGTQRPVIRNVATQFVRTLSFSHDGRRIATGGTGPARVWDAATGEEITTTIPLPKGMGPTFLPDGSGLAGWSFLEGRAIVCDLPSGKVRASWRAHSKTIEGVAVSRDGRFLATIGGEGVARIWSTADFTEVATTLVGHQGRIYAVAFAPDGSRVATGGGDDATIRIWDLPAELRR